MKMTRCLWLRLMLVSLLSVAGFAVSAEAATVSGTVTNNSGKTGRIYISGQWSGGGDAGWGVSINPALTTSFSIRGVQDGTYFVKAFQDTQNSGKQHANDPAGTSAVFTVTGGAPATNVGITLNNPSAVGIQPPTGVNVVPGDGCVLVTWDPAKDTNGREIATSYKVYWSTSASPGQGNMTGGGSSPAIPASDNYISALSNETVLYFAVTATLNGVESAPVNANGGAPITVGAPANGVTVSGTVTTTGATLGATPLYVALGGGDGPPSYIARIAAPSTSQLYSIPGVQPGSYGLYTIIDMNNDGVIDLGDISNTDGNGVPVTVAGVNVTNANVSLVAANAQVIVKTNHYRQGSNESYGVSFEVSEQMKRPVNVSVSGPQVAIMDMGLSSWGGFEAWPGVPNRPALLPSPATYSFNISYSDGTSTGGTPLTAPVTGIVDSFATPVSPVGYVPFPVPSPASFSWTPPLSAPNPYTYSFWLGVPNFNDNNTNNMPSNTTSVAYSYSFVEDSQYQWNIAVKDSLGNNAQSQVNFTSTSSPVITGFTPDAGVPGTPVTITGINFDGTTPANNQVYFPGSSVPAPVVSATTTELLVTVPAGAAANSGLLNITVGIKSGQSSSSFAILPTITMSGTIRDVAGVLAGATIELPGNALVTTTSGADGAYTLPGLPNNQEFSVKVSKTGYASEYSRSITTTTDLTGANFRLFAVDAVAGWGVTSGNGVIRGSVQNFANGAAIAGSTVTITASPRSYTVMYANATTFAPEAGAVTTSNGIFYILNVTPGDIVTVQAAATGFVTSSANYTAYADAVSVGGIGLMDNTRPTISAFALTTPYNNLTVPVSSFTAADNAAVTAYLVTESSATPLLSNPAWSVSPPATFTFSAGEGSRTAYGWARDAAGNISLGFSAVVTIDLTAPTTTASPVGGTQTDSINVTLTASEPATIYYTTNGTDPTYPVSGQTNVYTAQISISTSTTLKYFARDLAGNSETVQTQVYSYGTPTITTLSVTGQPATYTTSTSTLNLTATVTSTTTPTGSVDFLVDGVKVTTVALSGGVATATYGAVFTGGTHAVVANYLGNSTVTPPLAASTGNSSFTVAKANQTIAVTTAAPASATYNTIFTVAANAPAGSITYSSGSPSICTNSGATFTMVSGTGNCIVQYDQVGDNNFNAAPQVTSSTSASQATQAAVTVTAPTTAYYGQTGLAAVAAAGSGTGAYTYSAGASTACTVNSATGALTITSGTGTCSVTATKLADTNYSISAVSAASTITITKANQSITFGPLAVKNTIDLPFTLSATATSGLSVSYTSSNTAVATVSGNTVSIIGRGTTTITASQAGDSNWNTATNVQQDLTVTAGQTITVNTPAPSSAVYGESFTVLASSNSGLTVAYSSGSPSICNNSISAPATFTMLSGTGTCTVLYDQAGDATYLAAPQLTNSTTAVKATQVAVTVDAPASAIYGQTGLAATVSGGSGTGAYSYSAGTSTACSVNATTGALTITSGTGTCAITATRQADENYNVSAVSAADTVTINKATAMVTLAGLSQTYNGSARVVTATTTPAGLTVNITYDGSSTVPTNAANYAVVATINSANYQGTASGTLVIGRAAATVTISNLTQTADGTPKGVTITTTPANLAVTVTYNSLPAIPTAAGTYTVLATITDSNYTGNATASLKLLAYGDINADGNVNLIDALNCLKVAMHQAPQPAYLGNVLLAPLVNYVPTPGSRTRVDIRDASLILEKYVGNW